MPGRHARVGDPAVAAVVAPATRLPSDRGCRAPANSPPTRARAGPVDAGPMRAGLGDVDHGPFVQPDLVQPGVGTEAAADDRHPGAAGTGDRLDQSATHGVGPFHAAVDLAGGSRPADNQLRVSPPGARSEVGPSSPQCAAVGSDVG